MPCTVDPPTASERRAASKFFDETVAIFDDLTHRNDVLREWLLNPTSVKIKAVVKAMDESELRPRLEKMDSLERQAMYASPDRKYKEKVESALAHFTYMKDLDPDDLPVAARNMLSTMQDTHRVEDLKRLAKVAVDKWDMPLLKKVMDADPSKPLEPQLGFDPDSM